MAIKDLIMMLAIICDEYGGPEVLKVGERPMVQPNENERIIKVEYSALNRADTMQRMGKYPPPQGATDVLGLECSGYLVNTDGTVSETRVAALLPGGGYAQFVKVHKDHILELPE